MENVVKFVLGLSWDSENSAATLWTLWGKRYKQGQKKFWEVSKDILSVLVLRMLLDNHFFVD